MDYRIEKREEFKLLAKVKNFRNESVSEELKTEIPDFWSECRSNGTFDLHYGLYSNVLVKIQTA